MGLRWLLNTCCAAPDGGSAPAAEDDASADAAAAVEGAAGRVEGSATGAAAGAGGAAAAGRSGVLAAPEDGGTAADGNGAARAAAGAERVVAVSKPSSRRRATALDEFFLSARSRLGSRRSRRKKGGTKEAADTGAEAAEAVAQQHGVASSPPSGRRRSRRFGSGGSSLTASRSPLSSIELAVDAADAASTASHRRRASAESLLVEAKVTGAARVTEKAPLAGFATALSRRFAADYRTAADVAAYERAKLRARAVLLSVRSYRRRASANIAAASRRASRRLRDNLSVTVAGGTSRVPSSAGGTSDVVMEAEESVSAASTDVSSGETDSDGDGGDVFFEDAYDDFEEEEEEEDEHEDEEEEDGASVSASVPVTAASSAASEAVAAEEVGETANVAEVDEKGAAGEAEEEASLRARIPSRGDARVHNGETAALPSGVPSRFWACPGAAGLKVRGRTYLTDKVKVPAAPPLFDLMRVDIFDTGEECAFHIARRLRTVDWGPPGTLNTVLVNMMIPGPGKYKRLAMVAYFSPTEKTAAMLSSGDTSHPFTGLLATFLAAEPEVKNGIFKMIPKISEGSWLTKKAVGETPVIIGRKLETVYHRGPGYLEIDVDVSSDPIARRITGMCIGVVSTLVVDLAFLFEGHTEDELPEALLGSVSFRHMPMNDVTVKDLKEVEARLGKGG